MIKHLFKRFILLTALMAVSSFLWAGTFVIDPVHLSVNPKQPITELDIRNESKTVASFEVQAKRWTQKNGESHLSKTDDVIMTPPIFTVKPGKTQIIRIGLMNNKFSNIEKSYRVFLKELPSKKSKKRNVIQVIFNLSVPMFAKPTVAVVENSQWQLKKLGDNKVKVSLSNKGNVHLRVSHLILKDKELGKVVVNNDKTFNLLPGNNKSWTFKLPKSASNDHKFEIVSTTNWGKQNKNFLI